MKILFLSAHKYMPELCGGMEINTHDMIKSLQALGHESAVASGFMGGGTLGLKARLTKLLLKKHWVVSKYDNYNVYRSFKVVDTLVQIVKDFTPDCIIVQGGEAYYPLLECIASHFSDMRVISYFHTFDPLPLTAEHVLPKRLKYVANSIYTASLHKDKHIDLILPPLFFAEKYKTPQATRDCVTFINPSVYKGLETVIGLAKLNPEITFQFVVNHQSKIGPLQSENSLPSNVNVVGPFDDMREVYSTTKVLLAPSKCQETWGRIVTEAHFSGIPVLSSDAGGLRESVGEGGISLPVNSTIEQWQTAFRILWYEQYEKYRIKADTYSQRDQVSPQWNVNAMLALIQTL